MSALVGHLVTRIRHFVQLVEQKVVLVTSSDTFDELVPAKSLLMTPEAALVEAKSKLVSFLTDKLVTIKVLLVN